MRKNSKVRRRQLPQVDPRMRKRTSPYQAEISVVEEPHMTDFERFERLYERIRVPRSHTHAQNDRRLVARTIYRDGVTGDLSESRGVFEKNMTVQCVMNTGE